MPRPGPRPYECVRRAWHSESHSTMRGELTQEIFRLAFEIHGPTTRQNKEWQLKLPYVVRRAEEILYSKANSEVEYMDLKTLRSRVEDAVNLMIRRDESTEQGHFLKPCVEAALYLGCHPNKTPRGQRHNSRICVGNSQRSGNNGPTQAFVSPIPKHQECNGFVNTAEVKSKESNSCPLNYNGGNASPSTSLKAALEKQHCPSAVLSRPPAYLGPSMVPSSRVDSTHSVTDMMFGGPHPCSATRVNSSRNLNKFMYPMVNEGFEAQDLNTAASKGLLVQNLNSPQARLDSGVIFQTPWPPMPASKPATFPVSNPWLKTAFYPGTLSDHVCVLPSQAEAGTNPVRRPSPSVNGGDSILQCQIPLASKHGCFPVICKGKTISNVSVDDLRYNTENSYRAVPIDLTKVPRGSPEVCRAPDDSGCDLHLRLGPSTPASSFKMAFTGYEVEDLESSNCRAKTSADDLESLKVSDSFVSGSVESTQDALTILSPSQASDFDPQEVVITREGKGSDTTRYGLRTHCCAEVPNKIGRKYHQRMVKETFSRIPEKQDEILDLQIGLGLPLSRSCAIYKARTCC